MTAEQELRAHWRGIVESRDFAGVSAFADHLAELWPTVLREDAENFAETGYAASSDSVIDIRHGDLRFRVCQVAEEWFRVEVMGATVGRRSRWKVFGEPRPATPPPDRWEYERVAAFVEWVWGFLKPAEEEP